VALSKQKIKSKLNQINHCHSDSALSLSFCDIFEIRCNLSNLTSALIPT
jgi:hypothetical protein